MILFAASERVFGQLPWKKDSVRELFLLFAFFILIFILFFVFSIVWILAGDASHFRPLSSNSLPNRGIHMTLQFFPYANSGSTRPVGTASNHFFFFVLLSSSAFFCFFACVWYVSTVAYLPDPGERQRGFRSGWSINPLMCFFPCNDLSCEHLPYQRGKYLVRFNALCYRFVSSLGGYHYLW